VKLNRGFGSISMRWPARIRSRKVSTARTENTRRGAAMLASRTRIEWRQFAHRPERKSASPIVSMRLKQIVSAMGCESSFEGDWLEARDRPPLSGSGC
jgi:hypothetical protein